MTTKMHRQGAKVKRYIDTQTNKIKKLAPNSDPFRNNSKPDKGLNWSKRPKKSKEAKFIGA